MPPKTVATPEEVAAELENRVIDNHTTKTRQKAKHNSKRAMKEFADNLVKAAQKPDFEK